MHDFSSRAYRHIIFPAVLLALFISLIAILWAPMTERSSVMERILLLIGLLGSLHGLFAGFLFYENDNLKRNERFYWFHILLVSISLGIVLTLLPIELFFVAIILLVTNLIRTTLTFSIAQVRVFILITFLVYLHGSYQAASLTNLLDWIEAFSFPFLAFIFAETIQRFKDTISHNLNRVGTLNAISRKLSSSLDEGEVHTWLKEAIQDVFVADTYYLGLVNDDNLDLGLFYDDGEYYHAVQVPLTGSLSGWVIHNNKTLFLNDLRVEPNLEGVKKRVIGKQKSSLSWIGIPIKTKYVSGMIAIASYKHHAFSQDDVDMLESLGQQAALALNNARQHKLVTLQAQTDGLTKVYNHGYFLERLNEDLVLAQEDNTSLCLIMLDVDYFKQYNDTYGHLVGDEVLMLMVKTIKRFIKDRDSIGRWGGEEFVICLPRTTLSEAQLVASRIQETLAKMHVSVLDQKDIPVPTVSQGIAEFPKEADETFKLVDLADQRLYIAKKRGRNQIEPSSDADSLDTVC